MSESIRRGLVWERPLPWYHPWALRLGGCLLAVTLGCCLWAFWHGDKTGLFVCGWLWAVLPPAWFWWEYFYLFPRHSKADPMAFEHFKYGQQLSAAVWAGVLIALGVFASEGVKEGNVIGSGASQTTATVEEAPDTTGN